MRHYFWLYFYFAYIKLEIMSSIYRSQRYHQISIGLKLHSHNPSNMQALTYLNRSYCWTHVLCFKRQDEVSITMANQDKWSEGRRHPIDMNTDRRKSNGHSSEKWLTGFHSIFYIFQTNLYCVQRTLNFVIFSIFVKHKHREFVFLCMYILLVFSLNCYL